MPTFAVSSNTRASIVHLSDEAAPYGTVFSHKWIPDLSNIIPGLDSSHWEKHGNRDEYREIPEVCGEKRTIGRIELIRANHLSLNVSTIENICGFC